MNTGPGAHPVQHPPALPGRDGGMSSPAAPPDPVCAHPGCNAQRKTKSRYCAEHKSHKWDVWRWRQKKTQLSDPGLPMGYRYCRACQQPFRWRSPNHRYCDRDHSKPKRLRYQPPQLDLVEFRATLDRHGVALDLYRERVRRGWRLDLAMTTPPRKLAPPRKPARTVDWATKFLAMRL